MDWFKLAVDLAALGVVAIVAGFFWRTGEKLADHFFGDEF